MSIEQDAEWNSISELLEAKEKVNLLPFLHQTFGNENDYLSLRYTFISTMKTHQ